MSRIVTSYLTFISICRVFAGDSYEESKLNLVKNEKPKSEVELEVSGSYVIPERMPTVRTTVTTWLETPVKKRI